MVLSGREVHAFDGPAWFLGYWFGLFCDFWVGVYDDLENGKRRATSSALRRLARRD